MKTVRVERSYLSKIVQVYDVEVSDDFDFEEEWSDRFDRFDEKVVEGTLVGDFEEGVDNDDLNLYLVPEGKVSL